VFNEKVWDLEVVGNMSVCTTANRAVFIHRQTGWTLRLKIDARGFAELGCIHSPTFGGGDFFCSGHFFFAPPPVAEDHVHIPERDTFAWANATQEALALWTDFQEVIATDPELFTGNAAKYRPDQGGSGGWGRDAGGECWTDPVPAALFSRRLGVDLYVDVEELGALYARTKTKAHYCLAYQRYTARVVLNSPAQSDLDYLRYSRYRACSVPPQPSQGMFEDAPFHEMLPWAARRVQLARKIDQNLFLVPIQADKELVVEEGVLIYREV